MAPILQRQPGMKSIALWMVAALVTLSPACGGEGSKPSPTPNPASTPAPDPDPDGHSPAEDAADVEADESPEEDWGRGGAQPQPDDAGDDPPDEEAPPPADDEEPPPDDEEPPADDAEPPADEDPPPSDEGPVECPLGTVYPDREPINPDDPQYEDDEFTNEEVRRFFARAKRENNETYRSYKAAFEHPEPLYCAFCACGCDRSFGHKSNIDCFKDMHGFW